MKPFLAFLLVLIASPPAMAADSFGFSRHEPGDMEANFLVNLSRFVAWPHGPTDTATICFLGPSVVQARLESGVSMEQPWAHIPHRKVILKMLSDAQALTQPTDGPGCQVLFLDSH